MTIDDILDMSMDQIAFASRAVFKQKIKMLEMVFEPIATAFGGKKSKKKSKSSKYDNLTPEQKAVQRDTKLMFELQKAGIRISPS